ncbi:MAG: hypothetical protein WCS56_06370 [Bacilli bacterium]
MKGKFYTIRYVLSNDKSIYHADKRSKIMKEWEQVIELPVEKVNKYLKLHKGKEKDKNKEDMVSVVEIRLLDWVKNLIVNKVFNEDEEIK